MGSLQKNVSVELRTIIDDNGQMEYSTVKERGEFYQRGKRDVVIFEEKIDEQAVTDNLITIQPEKVSIKRTGMVSMNQQFNTNRTTENVYHHPHGTIHMETRTDDIFYQSIKKAEKGYLKISYHVKLNGQEERKHQLELIITEEGTE
ncbi:YwiB family protein [Virgibacillus ainsalahensis]